ncbi:MAG: beta-lactamase family protein [Deltaproteobacteria bacterium]|jgi:CubicO group peptidase (beta-lactamase class C family)|nr:beta-lactamase family protein [Deltaproteobacteria bacterium]
MKASLNLDLIKLKDFPEGPKLFTLLEESLDHGFFPGGVLAWGNPREDKFNQLAFGFKGITRQREPVKDDTIYDLASLTKLISTTNLLMLLEEKFPDTSALLKDLGFRGKNEFLKLLDLLSHQGGLPAWCPFYQGHEQTRAAKIKTIQTQILNIEPLFQANEKTLYSDLGFLLLGFILEDKLGAPLSELFLEFIAKPLDLKHTTYNPRIYLPGESLTSVAPTEDGFRVAGPLTMPGLPFRGPVPLGIPHDDNAEFLEGVAGHAGLFATAFDLRKMLLFWDSAYVGKNTLLKETTLKHYLTPQKARDGSVRALGFDLIPFPNQEENSQDYFCGHVGYTGPTLYWNPKINFALIFLTNRVNPTARNNQMPGFRKNLLSLFLAHLR